MILNQLVAVFVASMFSLVVIASANDVGDNSDNIDIVIRKVTDKELSLAERQKTYNAARFNPKDDVRFKREIAAKAEPSIASLAAVQLIQRGILDIDELIAPNFSTWTPKEHLAILSAGVQKIWEPIPISIVNLSRQLLKAIDGGEVQLNSEAAAICTLDYCALIVGRTSQRADRELLSRVFAKERRSPGLWLAMRNTPDIVVDDARKIWKASCSCAATTAFAATI